MQCLCVQYEHMNPASASLPHYKRALVMLIALFRGSQHEAEPPDTACTVDALTGCLCVQ